MQRIFFGVGQGTFYCEKFPEAKFQVIYDCGSFNRQKLVSEIEKLNPDFETVLFISHFHADHINGIPFLLKRMKEKRLNLHYIFFPYLTPKYRKLLIMYNRYLVSECNCFDEKGFVTRFIKNPWFVINNDIKDLTDDARQQISLRCVIPYNKNDNGFPYESEHDSWNREYLIDSGIDLAHCFFNKIKWQFFTYNLNENENLKKLKKNFMEEFDRELLIDELYDLYKNEDNQKKINKVFKRVGEINTNSMILFSMGSSLILSARYGLFSEDGDDEQCKELQRKNSSFLYTGDYNAKNNFLDICKIGNEGKFWDKIDGIQIPHHGSKHSFCKELLEKCEYCIISASQGKPYNHPDKEVLNIIKGKNRICVIINDKSLYTFCSY